MKEYQSLSRRKYFSSKRIATIQCSLCLKILTLRTSIWQSVHRIFCSDGNVPYISTVAPSHMWLLSMWNVAHATEQLNFKFYLVLINLNSNTCLVAGVWDSTGHSNLAPPKHTNEEERVVRFGGTGHHMVQEADLELTRGELMLATWRHFFILYLGHCPLDQCLLPWQPLAWLDFPFLSQAADGGHWWGSLSTGLMIWLKDLSL